MGLFSKRNIKNLLEKHKIQPSKGLGQNFLIDKEVVKKFIESAELKPNDVVLEIGPGLGVLTQELAKKAGRVIAVEKDPNMVKVLKELLDCWNARNVRVVKDDILKINPKYYIIPNTKYKIVANLPFYLTAPVIRKFLESNYQPREMILMVQKEVGQRICAKPPDMSLLAVSVQIYAKPEIISYISKNSFWPKPKVDSAIIRIAPLINTDRKLINADLFFKIVRAGFSQPRKQLLNNLSKTLKFNKEKTKSWLLKNKIQPIQRAETLKICDWINLTKSFTL
ncbi:MAG: 16S rRNA (adenine(1518)-N(6)/adenine(1519)-N(6))-dimethyltransferase RsmA [Candidatus Nealsonbacteria bacterium]|nr:16S rRNA (adenine(1518)-N(6)/adenine(1519)-N(6))-dimethyltransferase RsmA [Candidatus Nealsonbacteria bacterium]